MTIPFAEHESSPSRGFRAIVLHPTFGKGVLIFLGVLPALFLLADISAYAVNVPRGRSADAVILGVENAQGEWVAIAAGTPLSRPNYLRKSNRMDWEFLAISDPGKGGDWEIELPLRTFGDGHSGVLRAWAMDYRRHVLYRLPGDQKFIVIYKNSPPKGSEDNAGGDHL